MNTLGYQSAGTEEPGAGRSEGIVEIGLLLSVAQLARLDEAARQRRMTAAALVRRIIHDFLAPAGAPPQRFGGPAP